MKTMLRQLRYTALSHLAYVLGVLRPNMTEKELVDIIATYCADNRLQWSDLLSCFTFLQRPDVRKEIMTGAPGQTAAGKANSRTERLAAVRDTNPVSDLDAPIEGLSSSARAVGVSKPFAYAIAALGVDLRYHQTELAASTDKDDQEYNRFVIAQLEDAIRVLQQEGTARSARTKTR